MAPGRSTTAIAGVVPDIVVPAVAPVTFPRLPRKFTADGGIRAIGTAIQSMAGAVQILLGRGFLPEAAPSETVPKITVVVMLFGALSGITRCHGMGIIEEIRLKRNGRGVHVK